MRPLKLSLRSLILLDNYKIWNVSEYSYSPTYFNNNIMEYIKPAYPNPSLLELFLICKEIRGWLDLNKRNIAVIHCQKSRTRSALVLSCLLYDKGIHQHPCSALTQVCEVCS